MKHIIVTLLFLPVCIFSISAQTTSAARPGPSYYFNGFQDQAEKNADSAMYYIRQLAADPRYAVILQELLHHSFAQSFRPYPQTDANQQMFFKNKRHVATSVLGNMLADSNTTLVNAAQPIYYWVKMMENEADTAALRTLCRDFISLLHTKGYHYENRHARYALLIYKIIALKKVLYQQADEIFTLAMQQLNEGLTAINTDSASRQQLQQRAWHRYLYAYSNFVKANALLKAGNKDKAGVYFKNAFDYSPDLTDKANSAGYFYDMIFLFGKVKDSFGEEYLNYLTNNSTDRDKTLATILTMALTDPVHKKELHAYYNKHYPDKVPFDNFWLNSINNTAKELPAGALEKLAPAEFSNSAIKGKWILLDFWGTWCVPCRREHPALQQFYIDVAKTQPEKFKLFTIACRDTIARVNEYMQQEHYSFPVAMANSSIVKEFNVKGYPTKILITPQGKYVKIPFSSDWLQFIKQYTGL